MNENKLKERFEKMMPSQSMKVEFQKKIESMNFGEWVRISNPELFDEWKATQE